MRGRGFIIGAFAVAGLAAMLLLAVPSVLAVDRSMDKMIGPPVSPAKI